MYRAMYVALLGIVPATVAFAGERNYTLRGDGWFDGNNARFGRLPMREVRMTVRDNGEFAVTLFVRNERYLVRGRWDRGGRGNVERIDLDQAFGRRASGRGTLQYARSHDTPERLVLEGRTTDGTFRAEIAEDRGFGWSDPRNRDERDRADDRRGRDGRRDRDDRDDRNGWFGSFESNDRGNGRLRQDVGPDLAFDRMRVRLEANGRAWIGLEGRRQSVQLRGTWRADGRDVRIDLDAINEMRANGRLTLERSGTRVERLQGTAGPTVVALTCGSGGKALPKPGRWRRR
ncbi:MAG: hypothetical protein IPK85_00925 [Gemmatimonadetes bacterium]|nr:hypothetical protein [Gemmatimonadota bacterium]